MNNRIQYAIEEVLQLYSSEIERFLQERNYVVTPREFYAISDVNINTQIINVAYISGNDDYYITTDDNYCFKFKVKK